MISIEQLNGEIATLEDEKPTHIIMEKLANLYIVRDHMGIGETHHVGTIDEIGSSEFLQTVRGKSANTTMLVMDELMDVLKMVNPKLYDSVIVKLKTV